MLSPPVSPPDVPPWLIWSRKRIERIEQEHRFEVELLSGQMRQRASSTAADL
jgi:hypothetical protein